MAVGLGQVALNDEAVRFSISAWPMKHSTAPAPGDFCRAVRPDRSSRHGLRSNAFRHGSRPRRCGCGGSAGHRVDLGFGGGGVVSGGGVARGRIAGPLVAGPLVVGRCRLHLRLEALHRSPGLDQRAIDREVVVRTARLRGAPDRGHHCGHVRRSAVAGGAGDARQCRRAGRRGRAPAGARRRRQSRRPAEARARGPARGRAGNASDGAAAARLASRHPSPPRGGAERWEARLKSGKPLSSHFPAAFQPRQMPVNIAKAARLKSLRGRFAQTGPRPASGITGQRPVLPVSPTCRANAPASSRCRWSSP